MGQRKRREMRVVRSADIAELHRMVEEYNSEPATIEIINRQQAGRALRYYPDGRRSIEDQGFMPIWVGNDDGIVVIRFGRPNKPMVIEKNDAFSLIKTIPRCAFSAIQWHLNNSIDGEPKAEDVGEAEMRMEELVIDLSEDDFEFTVNWASESDDPLELQLIPAGAHSWYLSFADCALLVKSLCSACKSKKWVDETVSDQEMELISLLIGSA